MIKRYVSQLSQYLMDDDFPVVYHDEPIMNDYI